MKVKQLIKNLSKVEPDMEVHFAIRMETGVKDLEVRRVPTDGDPDLVLLIKNSTEPVDD